MSPLWTRAGLTWRELGLRIGRQLWRTQTLPRCAELAYFFLFSIFPLLVFLTTLLGYLAEVSQPLRRSLLWYIGNLSPSDDVTRLITTTLNEISAARSGGKLSVSLIAAVWVASNGMIAVSRTLNTACGLAETRPWWQRRIVAVLLTVAFALFTVAALAVGLSGWMITGKLARWLVLGRFLVPAWHVVRWALVSTFLLVSVEVVYNYAPNLGREQRREWGTPGGVTGVLLFIGASVGFRLYLEHFRTYTRTYGSLGVVIVLLIWFYLIAFALLVGGEVNAEIARRIAERREAGVARKKARRRP